MVLKSYVSSDATEESLERDTDRDLGVLTTPDDEA